MNMMIVFQIRPVFKSGTRGQYGSPFRFQFTGNNEISAHFFTIQLLYFKVKYLLSLSINIYKSTEAIIKLSLSNL